MTTSRLARMDDTGAFEPIDPDQPVDEDFLGELLDASPSLRVHASAAAVIGLVLGLAAVGTATFSLLEGLSAALAAVALAASVLGLARASRPLVAGTSMASTGLVLSLVAGAVYGLRYLGVDTAAGDAVVPALHDALSALSDLLPRR